MTYASDVGSRITMMAVLDYGIRVLASLGHDELGAVISGFLDDGRVISLNPVEGPEARARERARDHMTQALGLDPYRAAQERGAKLNYDALINYLTKEIDQLTQLQAGGADARGPKLGDSQTA